MRAPTLHLPPPPFREGRDRIIDLRYQVPKLQDVRLAHDPQVLQYAKCRLPVLRVILKLKDDGKLTIQAKGAVFWSVHQLSNQTMIVFESSLDPLRSSFPHILDRGPQEWK